MIVLPMMIIIIVIGNHSNELNIVAFLKVICEKSRFNCEIVQASLL